MIWSSIILVCSLALTPNGADCQPDRPGSYVHVMQGPDAPSLRLCQLLGQAYLAGTAQGRSMRPGVDFPKVRCQRTTIGSESVG